METVHSVSLQRGHSTPHMAGRFANEIGARRLVLNHLGGRFPAPGRNDEFRENVMGWIEQQATDAWAPEEDGAKAQAAIDFLTVRIKPIPLPAPPPQLENGEAEPQMDWNRMASPSSSTNTGHTSAQERRHGRYTGGPPTPSNEKVPRKRQRTERQVKKRGGDVAE